MQVRVTARHFKADDVLKKYVEKEVNQLYKFHEGIIESDVVLIKEKSKHIVEISLKVPHDMLTLRDKKNYTIIKVR